MSNQLYSVHRFRRAFVHFLAGRIAQAAASAVMLLAVVRLLSREDYGAYAVMIGMIELMAPLASSGLLEAGQRFVPQAAIIGRRSLYKLVGVLALARTVNLIVLAGLLWGLWPYLASWLHFSETHTAQKDWVILLAVCVLNFRYQAEILEAMLDQAWSQSLRAIQPILKLGGLSWLWVTGADINLNRVLAIETFSSAATWILASVVLGIRLRHVAEGDSKPFNISGIWRFVWHMAAVRWLNASLEPGAIRLVVAGFLGLSDAGMFGFLQNAIALVNRYLPGRILRGLIRPILISRYDGGGGANVLNSGIGVLWKSNYLLIGAIAVCAIGFGNEIIVWASGQKYTEAGLLLTLMLIVLAADSQLYIIEMVMQITGHTKELRFISFLRPVLLAMVWFAAYAGLYPVVILLGFGSFVLNIATLSLLKRRCIGFQLDWAGSWRIAVAIICGALAGLIGEPMLGIGGLIMAGAVYLLALLLYGPLTNEEVEIVRKGVGSRMARPFTLLLR